MEEVGRGCKRGKQDIKRGGSMRSRVEGKRRKKRQGREEGAFKRSEEVTQKVCLAAAPWPGWGIFCIYIAGTYSRDRRG
jgi:hypothetical protein